MNILCHTLRLLPPPLAERFYYRFLCGKQVSGSPTKKVNARLLPGRVAFNVLLGDVIGDSLYYTGVYEQFTTSNLLKIASKDGGLFVDVGANIGYYSLAWIVARQNNRCVAVEASPRNIELLQFNLEANELSTACDLKTVAASDRGGIVSFDQGPKAQTGWGGISLGVGSGSRVITVKSLPLDELVPEGVEVRLVKIDVEGAEALVLKGMDRLLRTRQVREIWFEDNVMRREKLGISLDELTEPLKRNGYNVQISSSANLLPMDFVATRPE